MTLPRFNFARCAIVAALLLAASPFVAAAQTTAPVPVAGTSPAPLGTYNDPAMQFAAPAGYLKLNVPPHDPSNFQQSTVVAAFVKYPGRENQRVITISMENWDGFNLDGFEGTDENEMRSQADSLFVSKKEHALLSNGMPAYWMVVSVGSGFDSQKWYQYVWLDGVRAVTLAIKAKL
ncbi:MAG: hypothetical protein ACREP1_04785, partial [Rhodanobacteraceae bacterium]